MRRSRGIIETLVPTLILSFLFVLSGCAVEEANTEAPPADDPPAAQAAPNLPETEAGLALAAILTEAGETDRLVLLHTGADW